MHRLGRRADRQRRDHLALALVDAHCKTRLTDDSFTMLHGEIVVPRTGELLAEDIDVGYRVHRQSRQAVLVDSLEHLRPGELSDEKLPKSRRMTWQASTLGQDWFGPGDRRVPNADDPPAVAGPDGDGRAQVVGELGDGALSSIIEADGVDQPTSDHKELPPETITGVRSLLEQTKLGETGQ